MLPCPMCAKSGITHLILELWLKTYYDVTISFHQRWNMFTNSPTVPELWCYNNNGQKCHHCHHLGLLSKTCPLAQGHNKQALNLDYRSITCSLTFTVSVEGKPVRDHVGSAWKRQGKANVFVLHLLKKRQFKVLYISHWVISLVIKNPRQYEDT